MKKNYSFQQMALEQLEVHNKTEVKNTLGPWQVWLSWLSRISEAKGLPASILGHRPETQDTCLGFGLGPWVGHLQEISCFSLTSVFLSPSSSLLSTLSKNK